MEYWTVLIITVLGGYMDGAGAAIPYPTEAACVTALTTVSNTLPYDHNIRCHVSEVPSASIRPQPRPEGRTE